MNRSFVIFRREWKELLKNKTFLQTLAVFPVLMVGLPAGLIAFSVATLANFAAQNANPDAVVTAGTLDPTNNATLLAGLIAICFALFLPVPAVLPMTVASYSIVNEKEKRSLEPLLVTPVKTAELIWGKTLSAIFPTCLAVWFCFSLLVVVLLAITPPAALAKVDFALWFAIIATWTPIIAAWTALVGISISSRAKDARAATQIGSLMVIPFIGLVIGVVLGVLIISWLLFFIGLVGGLALVFVTYVIAQKIFQRENILTRWK
jgi:ABC-2 type transport system permease protein